MSQIAPSFQGEVQFRRYSDTSTQGQQVVFAVQDREALESFVGMEGKRFMAVLVQIGDDEQPIPPDSRELKKPREYLGDLCYRAVQWCNDPEFQQWVIDRTKSSAPPSAEFAKQFIQMHCEIESRKELDTSQHAGALFKQKIVGPWQKHQQARRST